jgi:CheY-like chemotaxis protein
MNKRVLLIDDDEDEYDIFKEALVKARLPVECITINCSNGALKILETVKPDFIFVDYNMPAVNGVECIREIKKMDAMAHVPIIIFSTAMNGAIEEIAKASGATACIRKTDSVEKLSSALLKLLGDKQLLNPS